MNVRLLRKVAKHISEEPRRFIMGESIALGAKVTDSVWITGLSEPRQMLLEPPCGTAACIAGWTCLLTKHAPEDFISYYGTYKFFGENGIAETASKALDISDAQASKLFHVRNWGRRFRIAFVNAKTPKGRVGAALRRIEHFIKTKGEE